MQQALWITFWGFGITFGAIVAFWGLMWLMTLIPTPKAESGEPLAPEPEPVTETDSALKARAAAVAVAAALAEQSLSSARPLVEPPTAIVSAWQLGLRTRQLYQKGSSRRNG
jgi:hypothetical protein